MLGRKQKFAHFALSGLSALWNDDIRKDSFIVLSLTDKRILNYGTSGTAAHRLDGFTPHFYGWLPLVGAGILLGGR